MTADASSPIRLPGTPKPWMNTAMRTMLRTPGVRSVLGRTFGLITVIGAVTGASYTTPVQYVRLDDELVVLSQRHRRWWRNIRTCPDVTFEIGSRTLTTSAHVVDDAVEARRYVARVLRQVPRIAKFYDIGVDDDGQPEPAGVAALAERVVVLVIDDEVAHRRRAERAMGGDGRDDEPPVRPDDDRPEHVRPEHVRPDDVRPDDVRPEEA